jgi:hypothetical protein
MTLLGMNAPLPQQPGTIAGPKTDADYPTRLAEVKPGSVIRVGGDRVGGPAFTAMVLQAFESWGATGEPALFVSHTETRAEMVIAQSAGYEVTVVADASAYATNEIPAAAIRVHIKPVHGVALQFKGGVESATDIIRWCLGKGAPVYDKGDDLEPETIRFGGIGGSGGVARVGDWIIMHEDDTFHIHSNLADYEEEL